MELIKSASPMGKVGSGITECDGTVACPVPLALDIYIEELEKQ
jgi:hypothetical protein